MNKERYMKMKEWFFEHKNALQTLEVLYKILPMIMVIAVPALTIAKVKTGIDRELIRMIVVPMCTLAAVTIMRKIIKKPRPYEAYETEPLISRDGKGQSFPSRHTASAFIIAMCAIPVSIPVTLVLLFIATLIGITRILAGVHYITDVVAGMLFSVIIGLIFFVIL